MTDDSIDRLLVALDEAFRPYGYDRYDEGISKVAGLFKQIAETTSIMQNRDAFRGWLREIPDPEPAELEQAIQSLPGLVYIIRQFASLVGKRMPHPLGGHPPSTTPEQDQKIRAEIARLYDDGLRLGVAYERIAKKYKVSVRTVQRICEERRD